MSAIAIVQARMSSTRLPGKTLADVAGEPMLALLLRRLSRSKRVGRTIVATSVEPEDDAIAAAAEQLGVETHRGSRDDVLARFAGAARGHDGTVVRLTGDCPLTDPAVVDATIELLESSGGCAYASNVAPRTYPDGLDVEAFPARVLAELDDAAVDPADREHVTAMVHRDPDRWPAASLEGSEDLGELRWTVDTADDLEFVRLLAGRLGERRYAAGIEEIRAAVLADPSLEGFGGARRA